MMMVLFTLYLASDLDQSLGPCPQPELECHWSCFQTSAKDIFVHTVLAHQSHWRGIYWWCALHKSTHWQWCARTEVELAKRCCWLGPTVVHVCVRAVADAVHDIAWFSLLANPDVEGDHQLSTRDDAQRRKSRQRLDVVIVIIIVIIIKTNLQSSYYDRRYI